MKRAAQAMAVCLAVFGTTAPTRASLVERRVGVMGTWLALRVEASDRATALSASEKAVAAVEAAEARLSTWRGSSELSRLNAAPAGRPVRLSPELARDLALALGIAQETGGAFDPTVGPLVRCWGLRSDGRRPGRDERDRAAAATGFRLLAVGGRLAVRRRPTVLVEEGGFGKGIGLDDAVEALREAGAVEGLVDLGGQVAAFGRTGLEVNLAHPRDRARPVLRWRAAGGSIATSGNSERGSDSAGGRIGHLLDPRTGFPARDFGSVAVRADRAAVADALSTALFVLGPAEAIRWARSRPDIDVVVLEVTPTGVRARASRGLVGRLERLDSGVDLSFDEPQVPDPE